MDDPRPKLVGSIDCTNCSITSSSINDAIVLLLGGPLSELPIAPDDPKAPPPPKAPFKSMRDAIQREFPPFETFCPENIDDWLHDSTYTNLVSFEEDLAAISSLIVIIPESPGSIAELALFSQHEIAKKTLIFNSHKYSSEKSFINLGILRQLAEIRRQDSSRKTRLPSIKNYPWEIDTPRTITANVLTDIIEDISQELSSLTAVSKLKHTNTAHLMAAIYTLIKTFIALRHGEILAYLKTLGFTLSTTELGAKLFLLQKFHIIKKVNYDAAFYVAGKQKFHSMSLTVKPDCKMPDQIRIGMDCRDYYFNTPSERHRKGAITSHQGVSPKP